jgi:penicillin-binding protein 1A
MATMLRGGDAVVTRLRHFSQHRWFRLASYALAGLVILWAVVWLFFARGLPSVDKLRSYEPPLPTNVRSVDGTPVHSFARERRVQLSYNEFPPQLVHAFISAEDKSFFHHSGVDFTGVAGAAIDYVTKIGSGRRARGG